MTYRELCKTTDLLFVDLQTLALIFPHESYNVLKVRVSQLVDEGRLIKLKRGLYIVDKNYEIHRKNEEFHKVVAGLLKTPSYLSLEYVLRKYDVLTEATYGFTSVTTKKRIIIANSLGNFTYKQISKKLFAGYTIGEYHGYKYYEATKPKAMFDWLYYRLDYLDSKTNLVKEHRLKLFDFTKEDFAELEIYAELSGSTKKMKDIIFNLRENAHYY